MFCCLELALGFRHGGGLICAVGPFSNLEIARDWAVDANRSLRNYFQRRFSRLDISLKEEVPADHFTPIDPTILLGNLALMFRHQDEDNIARLN